VTTIKNPGLPATEADIATLERRVGFGLPAPFRAFLLKNDGGRPSPNIVDIDGFGATDVQVIFGIRRDVESSRLDWNLDTFRKRLRGGLVPIACDSGGNLFVLSRRDAGAVNYLDLEAVYGDLEATAPEYPVASDFDEFLSRLREL
jgi:hypothetical protein